VSLVIRNEREGLKRYVHLGTGNYNPATATSYTDLGLFTADAEIAEDASALFNLLTGYSQGHQWKKLIVAPNDLHSRTLELIGSQAALASAGKPSRIFAKVNSLADHQIIKALYSASQAGVPIEILSRGICCLRPGVIGLSENIQVRSIVDRFLEHSRIFIFGEGIDAEVYLGSADWMPRNFFRRVEVMFPVLAEPLKERLLTSIVPTYSDDTARARRLGSDGAYTLDAPLKKQAPQRSQILFMEEASAMSEAITQLPNHGGSKEKKQSSGLIGSRVSSRGNSSQRQNRSRSRKS